MDCSNQRSLLNFAINRDSLFNLANKVRKGFSVTSKRIFPIFILLFIITTFVFIEENKVFQDFRHNYYGDHYNFLIEHNETEVTTLKSAITNLNKPDTKYILYFHPYYVWEEWNFGLGHEPFVTAGCPLSNCIVTNNRTMLDTIEEFDAVLFHARNMDPTETYTELIQGKVPIPNQKRRRKTQRYVFFQMESPVNDPLNYTVTSQFRSFFNWTMTYRLDSDLPRPYGWISDKSSSFKYFPDKRPWKPFISLNHQQMQKYKISRPKMAAWIVSHCETDSAREDYVAELRKFMEVDQFGHCGDTPCIAEVDDNTKNYIKVCGHDIEKKYKFLLAFENSMCTDYVTEKMYNAMEAGIVPVVMGGANYTAVAPPRSYINVRDYGSPKELADKLLALAGEEEEYLQYFWWKEHYRVYPRRSAGAANSMCRLCQMLHDNTEDKVYEDLGDWWDGQGNCLLRKDIQWAIPRKSCFINNWLCYHWGNTNGWLDITRFHNLQTKLKNRIH